MSSAKPAPRAITGCRNLGILFLLLLFAAPLGLPLTALAVLGAALVLIMVLLMLPRVRYRAHRSRLGMIALIAALPVIAGVVVMAPGAGLPVIHDLSTDISDPPVFEAVLALRGPDTNPLARDADTDAAQRAGYPELRTIESVLAPAAAFARHWLPPARWAGRSTPPMRNAACWKQAKPPSGSDSSTISRSACARTTMAAASICVR